MEGAEYRMIWLCACTNDVLLSSQWVGHLIEYGWGYGAEVFAGGISAMDVCALQALLKVVISANRPCSCGH